MNAPHSGRQRPSISEIYQNQAEALKLESRSEWERSLAKCREALAENNRDSEAYIGAAYAHKKLGEHEAAITIIKQGINRCAPSVGLYQWNIKLLAECNRTEEAIADAREAMLAFPSDVLLKLKEALLLPILYDTTDEIGYYRRRFTAGLQRITTTISLDTPEARRSALSAIGNHTNVFLGYQGQNDRNLQMQYGQLVHRVMEANYPQWAKRLHMPAAPTNGLLRVGYVSSRFRNLSATKYFLGWLRQHAPERFVVYAYHVGRKQDAVTEEVRRVSRFFRQLSSSLEETCQAIRNDELHLLVFLDVGMDPVTTQLAALRLAPVQCAAWDHPITSGLPTIDYFISSVLAEPEEAQDQYSETLILLPGVGVCYQKPIIPTVLLNKTRRDFGIRENAIVYLCCQYAFKYLPDQDSIFAEIAKQVRNSQFVFLTENAAVASSLSRRLDRAFSAMGLSAGEHCVLLPAVDRFTYWNLYLIGDVFLDTIGWSGGVSTFEAIASRVPVVTLPGRFMRGRQSYAILTQLGVTDTISHNKQEYVEIAVRLGLDRAWRDDVIRRMTRGFASLYSDKTCVRALEYFFERAVHEGVPGATISCAGRSPS
jgi:protein O-GlcNAc transferase